MADQANELRQLARSRDPSAPPKSAAPGPAPRLIVLWSGKGGVGVTTLAVNLAATLVRDGHRTVLVDGDWEGADATQLCRLDEPAGIAEALNGRRTVYELLVRGPGGLQVLPGSWLPRGAIDDSRAAHDRLLGQLRRLGAHAEFVVIDAGIGSSRSARHYVHGADVAFAVAAPDSISIMDAYAAYKTLAQGNAMPPTASIVNRVGDVAAAADAQQRFERACRRFLGVGVPPAAIVPDEAAVLRAHAARRLFALDAPDCRAARLVAGLADVLASVPVVSRQIASFAGETI